MNKENIKSQLENAKVETLWQGAPTSIFVGTAAAIFLAATISSQIDFIQIILWLSAIFVTGGIRLYFALNFKKNPKGRESSSWLKIYFYTTSAVATVWSIIDFIVIGNVGSIYEIIVITITLAVSCGGAISSIAHKKTALYYAYSVTAAFAVNVVIAHGKVALLLSVSIAFFMLFSYRMISQFNKMYNDSVTLALELKDKIDIEKELVKEKERTFQSSKLASLGEMAAGIAHEINNPLTVSLGKIHMLRKLLGDENEDSLEIIQSIESSNVRISEIVFSMKSLSRMNQEPELSKFMPDELMQIVVPIVSTKIKWGKIDLNVEMAEAEILGNKGEVSQILINLIHNAADALSLESEKWIKVTGKSEETDYVFRVINPGDAIPSAIAEKLFEPFFTTKDVGKGTGLGLSLSKTLAQRSGGEIRLVEGEPNIIFELRLKLA